MALYSFECVKCGTEVEKLMKWEEAAPACEVCGGSTSRMVSLPAPPILKGPGFYATDYGDGAHNLEPYDQRIRAGNECHRHDLRVGSPGRTPIGEDQLKKMRRASERG